MHIIVCLKEVPATNSVRIDPRTGNLRRQGVEGSINPLDLQALEQALSLKARHGGRVTALCMGPPQFRLSLRAALARGADAAVLLSDPAFAGADTLATARTLAAGVKRLGGADLILCGQQTSDGETGQVGPMLAALLDLPDATLVTGVELRPEQRRLAVERQTEAARERLEVSLPALLAIAGGATRPRPLTVAGIARAVGEAIPTWGAADLGLDPAAAGLAGSPTAVARTYEPPCQQTALVYSGPPAAQAAALVRDLRQAGLLPERGGC